MAEVTVTVEQGKLKGRTGTDFTGKSFSIFQGIPYAKPPVGNLRFKDPQPAEPWEGTRDATKEGPVCLQYDHFRKTSVGSEDCLYLNVYTPQIQQKKDNALKPVMFWIHGGGFFSGSGNSEMYGPEYLVANDVVLVTINYRVGVLGFLKFDDPALEVPGNAGLKDIVLALRWVKSNIKNFLGDPDNITIFGESAGSAAVQYLVLSPLAKGLFHKAIMQSGSVFNPWASGHQDNELYSQILNLNTSDEKTILEYLSQLSTEDLLNFQVKLNFDILSGKKRPYGPSAERPSQNAFLPDDPKNIFLSGSYNKVPLIIGYCNAEGILGHFWQPQIGLEPIHTDFENLLPFTFKLKESSEESKRLAQKLKKFYYQDKEPSPQAVDSYVELETDAIIAHDVHKSVVNTINNSDQPVFFYRFCFDGEINFLKKLTQCKYKGAGHADELAYLFKFEAIKGLKPGSAEEVTVKRLTKLWTNFAKSGNPNPHTPDELLQIEWEPVGKNGLNYLNIDEELSIGVNPDAERMNFWEQLYENFPFAKFW